MSNGHLKPHQKHDLREREFHVDQSPRASDLSHAETRRWWAMAGVVWLGCLFYTCGMAVADPDLWGHTLYGLRAIDQGVLTESHDPFSFTAQGAAWINHEWLTEYQFGWLWSQFGELGLWWWRNAMVAVVFAVGVFALWRSRANLAAVIILLSYTALCLAGFCTFIRPQLATFALFAVTLVILRINWDKPTRWLWILPLLTAVWVNLHGGFLAGVGLQGVFAMGAVVRAWFDRSQRTPAARLAAVTVGSAAATAINPYGVYLHLMLWDHLVPEQAVREWQSLWNAPQLPMYYIPFVIMFLAFAFSRRWRWIEFFAVAVVSYQAVSHIRHVALLAIALLVLAPTPLSDAMRRLFRQLSRRFEGEAGIARRWIAVGLTAALLAALHVPQTVKMWNEGVPPWAVAVECSRDAPGVPLRAISLMRKEEIQGNLVTAYSWGQYMLWHLYPDSRVAFDGRYRTVYSPQLEREFLALFQLGEDGPPRTPMLDDYGAEIAVLPARSSTCAYLRGRADWAELLSDDQACLFVKRGERFDEVIARAEEGRLPAPPVATWTRFPGGPAGESNGRAPRGLLGPPAEKKSPLTLPVTAVSSR